MSWTDHHCHRKVDSALVPPMTLPGYLPWLLARASKQKQMANTINSRTAKPDKGHAPDIPKTHGRTNKSPDSVRTDNLPRSLPPSSFGAPTLTVRRQRKKEKLEEVKARLNFGDTRKKSTRAQESAYSESRTISPRRQRRSRSPRRNPSVFTRLRRERSRSPRHEYKNKERRESTVFKRLGSRGRSTSVHSDSRQESSRMSRRIMARHFLSLRIGMLMIQGEDFTVIFDKSKGEKINGGKPDSRTTANLGFKNATSLGKCSHLLRIS
ncbi:hypothetical protein Tco_0467622 [Tanacetum coccineum]